MNASSLSYKETKVLELLNKNKADGFIFISTYNRFWITGVNTTFGYAIVTKNNVYYLIDARDYECCKSRLKNIKCVLYKKPSDLNKLIKELKIKTLMFERDYVSYIDFNDVLKPLKVKLIPADTMVLRAQKTNEEIALIKKSMNIAVKAINFIKKTIKPGMTELMVKQALTVKMIAEGATATSFDLIVAFGENTANPHHQSTNKVLKKNEFITCDIGCIYKGYCSDITRTFWLGKPSKKMLEMYNLVLQANEKGVAAAKVGILGSKLDAVCRDHISKNKKYANLFCHGTGHGVGIEIHELPNVKSTYHQPILDNSIITIEPGIYEPGFGGVRIEDSILVTKNGTEVLTAKANK